MPPSQRRNLGLDLARMLAIVPVLLVHYATFALKDPHPLFPILGTMGVELFFALSGFLIGGIILRGFAGGFSPRVAANFYVRRWLRTLPLYWVFFAASAFVTAAGLRLDPAWTDQCWAYLLFLQNLAWPPLVPWYHESWSLAVEEWFYLLFPLAIAALPGLRPRARVVLVAVLLAAIPILLRMWWFVPGQDFDTPRRIVVLRLDAIAWGVLAVAADTAWPDAVRRWRHVVGLVGLAGIAVALQIFRGRIAPGEFLIHTCLFTLTSASLAALVLWARHQDWKALVACRLAPLVRWVSTRSYALYLCQGSVVKTMLFHGLFATTPLRAALVFFPAAFLLAEVAHRLVERPAMRLRPPELRTVARGAPVPSAPSWALPRTGDVVRAPP